LGAGAALLPLLPHRSTYSADPVFPKRLLIVLAPNGYPDGEYVPSGTGDRLSDLRLSETFAPLERWKDQLLMLAPLTCPNVEDAEDFHRGYSMMLTGLPPVDATQLGPSSVWSPTGPTVDQVIGAALSSRAKTTLRTLPLALPFGAVFGVDSKLEALRSFWIGQAQPVTPEGNPYKLVDQYFAGKPPSDPTMDRVRAQKRSMLDFLGRDLERFAGTLGSDAKLAVQGHLQAVRDLETQLAAPGASTAGAPPASVSAGQPLDPTSLDNYSALLEIQFDVAVAALRSDLTRVVTVQLGPAWGDALVFPSLKNADSRPWHKMGHEEMNNGRNEKKILDNWLMTRFSALLDRLAAVPEAGPRSKTLLDNTMVFWATTMLTGNHTPKLPWMFAGSCGGALKLGQYLRAAADVPANRVLTEMCNAMDVPATHFGNPDITGGLAGMRA
jgi:hypothetical protein